MGIDILDLVCFSFQLVGSIPEIFAKVDQELIKPVKLARRHATPVTASVQEKVKCGRFLLRLVSTDAIFSYKILRWLKEVV